MEKHILIVEDDKFLIELLAKSFSLEGFEVSQANDGIEAFKSIKKITPDLILLDLLLPDINGLTMDGFEILSRIKKDPASSQIPVIILSNLDQKEQIEKGLHLGAV